MYNKIILIGNLTRDPEIRHGSSGSAIVSTGIATNRKFKGAGGEMREETMFIDLSFFGRTAESAQRYLRRGSKVMIEGRLKLNRWTDAAGNRRSKHSVDVLSMQMLDSRQDKEGFHPEPVQSVTPKKHSGKPFSSEIPELSEDLENIPF